MDVDVTDTRIVLDDGDLRGIHHRLDQTGAAPRDDDVNNPAEGAEGRNSFTVGER